MAVVGTRDAGFSVESEEGGRTLRLSLWGFWGAEVAAAFPRTVMDACRGAAAVALLILDARELKPQRQEAQEAIGVVLAALPGLGIRRALVDTTNVLTKLQLVRIAKERQVAQLVQFTSDAPAGHVRAGER